MNRDFLRWVSEQGGTVYMKPARNSWPAVAFVLILTFLASPTILAAQEAFVLPSGKVGVAYEFTLQAEGGLPPLKWSVAQGELPSGIELSATGVVKGIPTTARHEPFQFTFEVTDSAQPPQRVVQEFSLMVSPARLRLILPAPPLKPVAPVKSAESSSESALPQPTYEPTRIETSYAPARAPHWVVPLQRGVTAPALSQSNAAQIQGASGNPLSTSQDPLDPATFIRVYEDTKTGKRLSLYEPVQTVPKRALQLTTDLESSIIIVPDDQQMGDDPALNKLYITARLTSGNSSKDAVVNGYTEVGKDKTTMAAQSGTAFQSAANVEAMVLNMAYTAGDVIHSVYAQPPETSSGKIDFTAWVNRHKDIDFRASNAQRITNQIAVAVHDKNRNNDHLQRLQARLRLYQPEIQAISDFLVQKENLEIVEKLGVKIFWIDRDSMVRIAQQYRDNIRVAFDPKSTDEAQLSALQDLLERTKLVYRDFGDLRREIMTQMASKYASPGEAYTDEEWETKYQMALQEYARTLRAKAVCELKRLLATGSISLTENQAKDGDRLTVTVESLPTNSSSGGIPAVFEIAIKKQGAKIQWSPSLLFVRRLGVTDNEAKPPAGSTAAPLNRINFAPSPGMTFGVAYFKRGNSAGDKFLRALGPGLGMNVTFMNFNDPSFDLATNKFVNTTGTNVQVGAGIIGSLFDNKIQLTYGWNLNVERRRTYFGVGFGFIEVGKELVKYIGK